ncbi:hypothetical protein VNO77_19582 [Canavalia gladiata]|uniref:Uncharacterized protein n=1 Tax=Canavalia gladiata TaxID=3824 RepID=A0AAN9LSV1_CANGL
MPKAFSVVLNVFVWGIRLERNARNFHWLCDASSDGIELFTKGLFVPPFPLTRFTLLVSLFPSFFLGLIYEDTLLVYTLALHLPFLNPLFIKKKKVVFNNRMQFPF